MGKTTTPLGVNPADQYRKKMREREAKKNKEMRKQMRETAVLYKDTSKLERKIERYHNLKRKMTAAEKEKLQSLETELKETLNKQKEAGIELKSCLSDGKVTGYDPLAEAEEKDALVQYASSDSEDYDESNYGKMIFLDQDNNGLDIQQAVDKSKKRADGEVTIDCASVATSNNALFPPMPLGTPPPFSEAIVTDIVWPPLPSGPSPQFRAHNPHLTHQDFVGSGSHGRGRGNMQHARGRGRGRDGRGCGSFRQHPYSPRPVQAVRADSNNTRMPYGSPPIPPFAVATHNQVIHNMPPGLSAAPTSISTVLSAEPQVRDLKKELTTLVPSTITRKNKQKDRQRVLDAIPMAPQMVVNAAPDVDGSAQNKAAFTSNKIINNIQSVADVRFSTTSPEAQYKPSSSQQPQPDPSTNKAGSTKQANSANSDSLDEEYKKFTSQMGKLI
ncbi:hypothetical protein BX070DRAFT_234278 [Coemansia spiralis]|nr:hypothetical protein BX070DRAFT_234278 [Coemansia spiralis]